MYILYIHICIVYIHIFVDLTIQLRVDPFHHFPSHGVSAIRRQAKDRCERMYPNDLGLFDWQDLWLEVNLPIGETRKKRPYKSHYFLWGGVRLGVGGGWWAMEDFFLGTFFKMKWFTHSWRVVRHKRVVDWKRLTEVESPTRIILVVWDWIRWLWTEKDSWGDFQFKKAQFWETCIFFPIQFAFKSLTEKRA